MSIQKNRRKPVLVTALRYIREYVRENSLKPGDPIPPTRAMAKMAGVSYVTICRALQEMKKSGELTVRGNRRYLVARSATDDPASAPLPDPDVQRNMLRPWQRAAERITADIVNGAFRPGSALPSIKELERRYGISYRTVRKGLDGLAGDGLLEGLTNGGFAVPSLSTTVWRPRLVCFVQSIDSFRMDFGQHDETLFRELEAQCEQAKIKVDVYLVFAVIDILDHRLRHKDTGRVLDTADLVREDDPSVLGYAYFIPWEPEKIDRRTVIALERLKKSVAVIDETGSLALPPDVDASSWLRKLTIATSPRPAQAIARHLLSLGHRTIAFFSADHQYTWSRKRLEGLEALYGGAGGSVTAFVSESESYPYDRATGRCDFPALDAFYAGWRTRLPAPFRVDMDYAVERLHVDTVSRAENRLTLMPMLEEALTHKEITAWVMVNDLLASMAMALLKEKGIRVPADLSLISFDDSREALRNNFSSFNFNAPAVAASLLGFVLNRKTYAKSGIDVEGFIVDRGSTGPAPRRKK